MPPNTTSKTVQELLLEGKRFLAAALGRSAAQARSGAVPREPEAIAFPALDAALLLAEVSDLSREALITHNERVLDEARRARYFDLLKRRAGGECTAYILGRKEFWGLELTVTPAVLVPRPDTEILVEAALGILRAGSRATAQLSASVTQAPRSAEHAPVTQASRRVLDLCTGSGAVALALKHELPELEVWASDLSEAALGIARTNVETLGLNVKFVQGDLFDALKNAGPETACNAPPSGSPRFTLITANAPYVPSGSIPGLPLEVQNEPRLALDGGKDGLDLIRRIAGEAPLFLEPGGSLALEADPSQMETIAALLKNSGFGGITLHRDLAGNNRVIAGKANTDPL